MKLRIPFIGPILRKIILSRFASVFAMMYASGIAIIDCDPLRPRMSSAMSSSRKASSAPAS